MKEQFVTYEIALKLKEIGFDEPCLAFYDIHLNLQLGHKPEYLINNEKANYIFGNDKIKILLAPLYQQVIDWFREEYYIHILINPTYKCFSICISKYDEYEDDNEILDIDGLNFKDFITYHEAREQAILKAIELCRKY